MSLADLFEDNEKIQALIASLLDESRSIEFPVLEWLSIILETESINSLVQLADNPMFLLKLASLSGLHSAIVYEKYSKSPNIVSFVNLLAKIWDDKKKADIFKPFTRYFSKKLNPGFVFEQDFESLIYSHSQCMVYTIIIVAVLSIIMIHQNGEDESLAIFSKLSETSPYTQEFMKAEFRNMVALYDEINNFMTNALEKQVIKNAGFAQNEVTRFSGLGDLQVFRRIVEQTDIIEQMKGELTELKVKNTTLKEEADVNRKIIEEKEKEIQHLKFSREDLLQKLKNKKLEFMNDIVVDKEQEIKALKERIQQIEQTHKARLRDLEDERDGLHKKIHTLQNYKTEFESFQTNVEKQTNEVIKETHVKFSEEMQQLKEKIAKLQETSIIDKEKYLDLEMKLSKQNMEIHSLKMERQNLEYKIKELESHNDMMCRSEVYTDNIDEIAKELSCSNELAKFQNLMGHNTSNLSDNDREKDASAEMENLTNDSEKFSKRATPVQGDLSMDSQQFAYFLKEIKYSFANYERRCLNRIRTVLKELKEERERTDEMHKEIEHLKDEIDDLSEKSSQLENGLVEKLVEKSPLIQELLRQFGGSSKEGSEIAQDLLKTVLKREHEINRLKSNRKKLNNEILNAEARCIDTLSVMYTVVESFFAS